MGVTWVEANAGSGKTTLLVGRVLDLLRQGAEPGGIVCLTYTRLAAHEIKIRLRRSGVATLPNIDTLHAFCQKHVLDARGRGVLDQDAQNSLICESVADVVARGERGCGPIHHAFLFLKKHVTHPVLIESLEEGLRDRRELVETIARSQWFQSEHRSPESTDHIDPIDPNEKKRWFTRSGEIRRNVPSQLRDQQDAFVQRYRREGERLSEILHRRFFELVWSSFKVYTIKKQKSRSLDYHDILIESRLVLSKGGTHPIRRQINHILVDEAQDLSELEWDIIEQLSDEFFVGPGGRDPRECSLFVVGDPKQSIFSFQGACPRAFVERQKVFMHRARLAKQHFEVRHRTLCFRTAPEILAAVDAITKHFDPTIFSQPHASSKHDEAGFIEVWDQVSKHRDLSQRIAKTLRALETQPGDALLLFHTRGVLWDEISQALVQANLLPDQPSPSCVMEKPLIRVALACAHVVLNPHDDYHLAVLLTSPFFGLSPEDLFTSASGRQGPLIQCVRNQKLNDMRAILEPDLSPSIFFTRLFRLWKVSTPESNALLDQANIFEERNVPSMALFLSWIRTRTSPLKQDPDPSSRVRLLTVHAAKGTEASFVFLPDTLSVPTLRQAPRWLEIQPREQKSRPFCWRTDKSVYDGELETAKQTWIREEMEEYNRLLYVAMTRAKTGLFVGACGPHQPHPLSWYTHIRRQVQVTNKQGNDEST